MENKKKRIVIIIAAVALAMIVGCLIYIIILGHAWYFAGYLDDLVLISPDGNHKIVIKERQWFNSSEAEFYYVSGLNVETYLGKTISRSLPYHDGEYSVEWRDQGAKVTCSDGKGGEDFIEFDYPENVFPVPVYLMVIIIAVPLSAVAAFIFLRYRIKKRKSARQ